MKMEKMENLYRIYNNNNNKSVERNTEEKIDFKNIMPCAKLFGCKE